MFSDMILFEIFHKHIYYTELYDQVEENSMNGALRWYMNTNIWPVHGQINEPVIWIGFDPYPS